MELKKYKLGEFVQSYGDGIHGTPEYNESGEYYFINGNNLETGKIVITDNTLRITETEYQKIKRLIVKGKTILVSINGTLGRYAIYNGEKISLGKSACFLNLKDAKDVPFILTVVKAKEFTSYLERIAGQSTIKNVSPTQVINYEFYAPALYENCLKNSTFLLKLDRKIELNRLINQNLTAMAKQLYDYWFVQFDFPNEEGKPYKSSGGEMVWNKKLKREIPKGWNISLIKDFATTYSGGTPKSTNIEYYNNGEIAWINSGELNSPIITKTTNYITKCGLENSSAKLYPSNSILVAMYGATAGKVSLLTFEACSNQAVCGIIPTIENMLYYVYFHISSLYSHFITLSTGSARDNISQNTIKNILLPIPTRNILKLFDEKIGSIYQMIVNNYQQIDSLAMQRDELLPLLMNGQVSVNSDLSNGL